MSFSHCLVLVQTSIPITLLYTFFFGTDDWLDITIISILTLVLGYLIGSPLYMSTLLRFYCGTYVTEVRKRVMKSIIIFDIENDPRCMAVRECLSIIDAPILVYPIPIINKLQSIVPSLPLHSRFLHEYRARSGQQEVKLPFMEDPNTGVQLCGDAEDIVMYLYVTYCRQGAHMDRQPPLGGGTGMTRSHIPGMSFSLKAHPLILPHVLLMFFLMNSRIHHLTLSIPPQLSK